MDTLKSPRETNWAQGTIFTLGHSTLSSEKFFKILKTYGIQRLVDIRTIPRSRYNPQFNKDSLAESCKPENIDYVHIKALGGRRSARKDSVNTGWRNGGFRGYADYMETAEFQEALEMLIDISRQKNVAIMCAEAVPWRCHRSLVSDALNVRGIPVIEIFTESNYRAHKLTPFAKVNGLRITYPPEQPLLL
jgi:uncharacterized protein (DUF488 family)